MTHDLHEAGTGRFQTVYGVANRADPTYTTWQSMNQRCNYPAHKSYARYGGRGISVCARWADFCAFLADMGPRPAGTTLDRFPNADGNYEPGNCRWATSKQQSRNRRSSVWISHGGETLTLVEWAEKTGIKADTIAFRLRAGWPADEALTRRPSPLNGLHRGSVMRVDGLLVSKEVQP